MAGGKVQGTSNPTKPAQTGKAPYAELIKPGQPTSTGHVTPKGPGGYTANVTK